MKSIVGLKTKNKLPKWTENQVTQSSRDVKNFGLRAHRKEFQDKCEENEGVSYEAGLF